MKLLRSAWTGRLNSNLIGASDGGTWLPLRLRRLFGWALRRLFRPRAPGSSRVGARERRSFPGRRLFRARLGGVACRSEERRVGKEGRVWVGGCPSRTKWQIAL